ncbi:glucan endo-1,3-beta-glucosidase 14 isoform X1 [Carica papaya]|uniref:glucan endo-1,3-beta-glucosidase 14 isoform X1 n=2 Tax=Carica papaya TaxID=3649 RepID=UPI000B8CD335|nr:glucan endo-1,3-beta-glucosidase 14 isoform X1 [Carica papaya]
MEFIFFDDLPSSHMAFSSFFIWLLLIFSVISSQVFKVEAFTGTYGVNYGKIADNLPSPRSVVTLLRAAKVKNIRIYDADHEVLKAFKGSGIEIVVGLGNEYLKDMSVAEDRAMNWLKENVEPFLPGTRIRGIAVGNEILGGTDLELGEVLLPAAKNVYTALHRLNLTHLVEVSSPHSEAVFMNSYPPSACTFKEDVLQFMKPLLQFFSQIGSPFYINAYPFLAYKNDPQHIDINYALFKDNPGIHDAKTNLHYDNMFEAQVDAAYAALEKAGFDKMEVIVSETGWASHGDPDEAGATLKNARTYNRNLRKRLLKKKGTPYRPKTVVRAYVFALFNENLKPGPTSERNFGLFKPDGSIAYDIGFTGLVSSAPTSSLLSFKEIVGQGWFGSSYTIVFMVCMGVVLQFLSS